jgi:geranylgeranyl reductase family protein
LYDLIVVGAGPSGTMCARKAATRGLSVLLIEKEYTPRDKLCGGALSRRVIGLVDFDLTPVLETGIRKAMIYGPDNRGVKCERDEDTVYMVKRPQFDRFLLEKAKEAGVEVLEGTKIVSVEQLKKGIRVLAEGDSYQGHLLVGADGVNSIIARSLEIRNKWAPDSVALCIAADVPMSSDTISSILSIDESRDNALEIYLWAAEGGYGWCFPKRDEISIGIGYQMSREMEIQSVWRNFIADFEKRKGITLKGLYPKSMRVPLGGVKQRITARRTMLVGDAAGFVSPVTAEGIYYAIASGLLAGRIASETIRAKDSLLIKGYEEAVEKGIFQELEGARSISQIAYKSRTNIDLIMDLAQEDPVMRELMVDLFVGARPIQDLKRQIVKRILIHHPLKGIKMMT